MLFGIPAKWVAVGLAAASAGLILYVTFDAFEDRGALKERATTIEQNKEAGNAGENARLNMHECISGGLQFNFETGKCGR